MNQALLIVGEKGAGKTSLARQFTETKKTIWLVAADVLKAWPDCLSRCDADTQAIVVEAMQPHHLNLIPLISGRPIYIEKVRQPSFKIRPEFYFISTCSWSELPTDELFRERVAVCRPWWKGGKVGLAN